MATTLFTAAQRASVDDVLDKLETLCLNTICSQTRKIEDIDDRPIGVYNPSDPDDAPEKHRFRYVGQGMLEDLIERLEVHV